MLLLASRFFEGSVSWKRTMLLCSICLKICLLKISFPEVHALGVVLVLSISPKSARVRLPCLYDRTLLS